MVQWKEMARIWWPEAKNKSATLSIFSKETLANTEYF